MEQIPKYTDCLPIILAHLSKLGPEGGGFEFGYDIFPDNAHLDDVDDLSIFTG